MLSKRILAATVIVLALAGAMWADLQILKDSAGLHAFFLFGVFASYREFWALCRATGHQTFSIWGTFSGCTLVAVHYFTMRLMMLPNDPRAEKLADNILLGTLAAAILGTFLLSARRKQFEASLGGVAVTAFGLLYIFLLPSFLLRLRHLGEDGLIGGPNWNVFGHNLVVATLVIAKGCDVFALLTGKVMGRHKAFPNISPGKTIEGLLGGLTGSVLLALFLHVPQIGVLTYFSTATCLFIGLCIGFAGIMGDLAESLLKRSAGTKDAGTLVPGFGGALDVVDSIMVAGPVAYFLFSAML